VYLLDYLFQGGPEPVEIVCPVDQSDRVAELESQLAGAAAALEEFRLSVAAAAAAAEAEARDNLAAAMAAANAENDAQAGQLTALQDQLTAANAQVAAQAEQIAELEGQDNSDCSDGLFSPFVVGDCPPELARSVARTEDGRFDDEICQMLADDIGPALWRVSEWASRAQEDPDDIIAMDIFTMELSHFFESGGPMASDWLTYCELECPE
jgi:hypothetical protein